MEEGCNLRMPPGKTRESWLKQPHGVTCGKGIPKMLRACKDSGSIVSL